MVRRRLVMTFRLMVRRRFMVRRRLMVRCRLVVRRLGLVRRGSRRPGRGVALVGHGADLGDGHAVMGRRPQSDQRPESDQ